MAGMSESQVDFRDTDGNGLPIQLVDGADLSGNRLSILAPGDAALSSNGLIVFGLDPSDNAKGLSLDAGGNLKVTGGGGGFEVLDNQTASLGSDLGGIFAGYDGSEYQFVSVNTAGRLQVDVVSGGTSGQQVADSQAPTGGDPANDFGNIAAGYDGANYQFIKTDAAGELQVDVLTLPAITGTVTANQGGIWNINDISGTISLPTGAATQVTLASILAGQLPDGHNVTVDNAAGAAAVNIQDGGNSLTIDNANIDVALSTLAIAANQLPDGHNVTVDNAAGAAAVNIQDGGNSLTIDNSFIDAALSTLATQATLVTVQTAVEIIDDWDEADRAKVNPVVGQAGLAAGTGVDALNALRVSLATDVPLPTGTNRIGGVRLVDRNDYPLDLEDEATIPANYSVIMIAGHNELATEVRSPTIILDAADGYHRMAISGKVSTSPPAPPPSTTAVTIDASTPLDVANTHTTDVIIGNGLVFHILQIIVGAEGDPNEKGSKVEIIYVDSSSVEHLIDRLYVSGFTEFGDYPDTSTSRDNTSLAGDGVNTKIRIIRTRLGGAALEIDAVVRGYTV